LFFIEKKDENKINYESPLNYIGSKSKMILKIKKHLPNDFDTFIDSFGGGFNVGININTQKIVYNDINYLVKDLVESFKIYDTYDYILYMQRIIKKFGLEPSKSESYMKARDYYNSLPLNKKDSRLLYTIILYGYNQQIRFNGNHKFNNPVGMRWFNNKVLEKMISFSRIIKKKHILFESNEHQNIVNHLKKNSFVYMDPPYRLTTGSYNDGKRGFNGWNIETEAKLLDFADKLNKKGKLFMISYVLKHKGHINDQLKTWIKNKGYRIIPVKEIPGRKREEILIVNYD